LPDRLPQLPLSQVDALGQGAYGRAKGFQAAIEGKDISGEVVLRMAQPARDDHAADGEQQKTGDRQEDEWQRHGVHCGHLIGCAGGRQRPARARAPFSASSIPAATCARRRRDEGLGGR